MITNFVSMSRCTDPSPMSKILIIRLPTDLGTIPDGGRKSLPCWLVKFADSVEFKEIPIGSIFGWVSGNIRFTKAFQQWKHSFVMNWFAVVMKNCVVLINFNSNSTLGNWTYHWLELRKWNGQSKWQTLLKMQTKRNVNSSQLIAINVHRNL